MALPGNRAIANKEGPSCCKTKNGWNAERDCNLAIGIREQLKRQPVLCSKLFQTDGWITAHAENLKVARFKLVQSIAKSASMRGTNGRSGPQVKVNKHRTTRVSLGKIDNHAIFIDRLHSGRALGNLQAFVIENFEQRLHVRAARIFASSTCKWARSFTKIAPVAAMALA